MTMTSSCVDDTGTGTERTSLKWFPIEILLQRQNPLVPFQFCIIIPRKVLHNKSSSAISSTFPLFHHSPHYYWPWANSISTSWILFSFRVNILTPPPTEFAWQVDLFVRDNWKWKLTWTKRKNCCCCSSGFCPSSSSTVCRLLPAVDFGIIYRVEGQRMSVCLRNKWVLHK